MKLKERKLWDLSGDIGVQIGLNLKDLGILPECFAVYGIDFGQELIYNVMKEIIAGSVTNED